MAKETNEKAVPSPQVAAPAAAAAASADGSVFMSRELFEQRGFRPETYDQKKAAFEEERVAAEKDKAPGGQLRVKIGAGTLTAFGANDKRHWYEGEVLEGVSSQDVAAFWKLGVLEVVKNADA